jgi:hypothetical protein
MRPPFGASLLRETAKSGGCQRLPAYWLPGLERAKRRRTIAIRAATIGVALRADRAHVGGRGWRGAEDERRASCKCRPPDPPPAGSATDAQKRRRVAGGFFARRWREAQSTFRQPQADRRDSVPNVTAQPVLPRPRQAGLSALISAGFFHEKALPFWRDQSTGPAPAACRPFGYFLRLLLRRR